MEGGESEEENQQENAPNSPKDEINKNEASKEKENNLEETHIDENNKKEDQDNNLDKSSVKELEESKEISVTEIINNKSKSKNIDAKVKYEQSDTEKAEESLRNSSRAFSRKSSVNKNEIYIPQNKKERLNVKNSVFYC